MKRLLSLIALSVGIAACAVNLGGPRNISLEVVAFRAGPDGAAGDAAAALLDASAGVALVAAPADSAWFAEVAGYTGLTLSGPASADGMAFGFLAGEPVGDTTVTLQYDGGTLTLHDALYEQGKERFLDLMAFQLHDAAAARPAIAALLEYMATDVDNSAAVVMAVAVPSAAVGDSVRRMLSPAYRDGLRCEPGLAPPEDRSGIRLFYGPEARVFCRREAVDAPLGGDRVRATLVLGRR